VNETGLLIAEVAFLVLLYAFVWSVVRSASRQLPSSQPPPPPAPVEHVAELPPAAVPAPPPAPAPVVAPPAPVPAPEASQPTVEPLYPAEAVAADPAEDLTVLPGEPRFDLHGNLDPRLVVESSTAVEAGTVIPLEGGITIGRSGAATLSIGDQFVSHMHARILRRGAYHFVEDLGSTNGTFLNDRRVERDAQLKVHDSLRIGQTILRYEE
jgi:hypothetical protein